MEVGACTRPLWIWRTDACGLAIAADHIVIGELDQEDIAAADPAAAVEYLTSNGISYPLVKSQPIDPKGWYTTWNEAATDFAGKTLYLLNTGHGKSWISLSTERNTHYCLSYSKLRCVQNDDIIKECPACSRGASWAVCGPRLRCLATWLDGTLQIFLDSLRLKD